MTDIVKRLRLGAVAATDQLVGGLHRDAADEIERQREDNSLLRNDRDDRIEDRERLQAAISDNLPGLASIDAGSWHEYTGDFVLKEEQWNAIVVATRELRVALAGGEATSDSKAPEPGP